MQVLDVGGSSYQIVAKSNPVVATISYITMCGPGGTAAGGDSADRACRRRYACNALFSAAKPRPVASAAAGTTRAKLT